MAGEKIIPGVTLIIFDEVQECPVALNSLNLKLSRDIIPTRTVRLTSLSSMALKSFPLKQRGGEDKSAPSFKRYIIEKKPEHAIRFSKRGYLKIGLITNMPLYLARKMRDLLD